MKDLKESGDIVVSKRMLGGHVPGASIAGDFAAKLTGTAGELKAYNLNASAVADELTKVFRGSGGSEADIQSWKEQLNDRNTASENSAVLQKGVDLMAGQIKGLFEKYVRGMGVAPSQPLITKDDIDTLESIGVNVDKLRKYAVAAPSEEPPAGQIWVSDKDGNIGSIAPEEYDKNKYIKL
jgi:hypothetical protein